MILKPQDILVVLHILIHGAPRTYADLARRLGISASEAHASTVRALKVGLLMPYPHMGAKEPELAVNKSALEEFLVHGIKYVFPAERGPITRGVPTSYAVPPLSHDLLYGDDDIPVWSDPEGIRRGVELKPLYYTVPKIVKNDSNLYEWLALVDALRSERARERDIAKHHIQKRLYANPTH